MADPASLTLTRPDDWHLHLRDGAALAAVLPFTARSFARAVVMPNLRPPVATTAQALAAHRPLGEVMRARKVTYFESQKARGAAQAVPPAVGKSGR